MQFKQVGIFWIWMDGSPFKSKKARIFWICYYGTMLAANVLALIFFREHIRVSWLLLLSIYAFWGTINMAINPLHYLCFPDGRPLFETTAGRYENRTEHYDKELRLHGHEVRTISMIFAPLHLPTFFFFTDIPKLLITVFIPLAEMILLRILIWVAWAKDINEQHQQRKEQERKEELGKWK